jgi:hypothetical protein
MEMEEEGSTTEFEAMSEQSDISNYSTPMGPNNNTKKEVSIKKATRNQKSIRKADEQTIRHEKQNGIIVEKEDMDELQKIIDGIIYNTGRIQQRLSRYVARDSIINGFNQANMACIKKI